MLEIGKKAPSFSRPSLQSEAISLADYSGRKIVLFFYPKDNTPGCTTEATGFSADLAAFEAENCVILGISKDTLTKHKNFTDKHALTVDLISDESGEMCEAYGVWKEKKLYGKTYMGIERSTFLIDEAGVMQQIWRKVRVKDHVAQVLDAVRAL